MDDQIIFVYITASSKEEALLIGRDLVDKKLAACVNVLGSVNSIYRWEGSLEEAQEIALLAKSRRHLFGSISERVKEKHSYNTPCIISFHVDQVDSLYGDWIIKNTLDETLE